MMIMATSATAVTTARTTLTTTRAPTASAPTATTTCSCLPVWERGLDSTRISYRQLNGISKVTLCASTVQKRSRSLPSLLELIQDIDFDLLQEEEPQAALSAPNHYQKEEEEMETDTTTDDAVPCRDASQLKQRKEAAAAAALASSSAAAAARDRVLEFFQADSCFSPFFPTSSHSHNDDDNDDHDLCTCTCTLKRSEICMGKTLGRGGFAEVRELSMVSMQAETQDDDHDVDEQHRRLHLHEPCLCPSGQTRYAIKQVRRDLVQQAQNMVVDNEDAEKENDDKASSLLWAGMIDLAVETMFLRHLNHPHIVKLCGVACDENVFSPNYFVILDRLHDTLYTRIHEQWKPRLDRETIAASRWALRGNRNSSTTSSAGRRSIHFLRQRLSVARDISSAIAYLHDMHVCHRDLKPCNVGFDVNGSVKVFDFGLARELPHHSSSNSSSSSNNGVFHLTQMTGTLRFMAPEVAMGRPYNEQCDVYSFALIVWEMLTCTRPYAKLQTEKAFVQKVFEQGLRPKIPTSTTAATGTRHCPASVMEACQDLLQGGWDANLSRRWTIHQMQATLESICTRLDESSSSSCLQQQQQLTSSSSKKHFFGRMMTTTSKKANRLLSWPKRFLVLPYCKQLHVVKPGAPQSGRTSTTQEEEEDSFLGGEQGGKGGGR